MGLSRILKHTAVLHRVEASGEWIEGERTEFEVHSPAFPCVVFPPGTREAGRGGRRIEQPLMLYRGYDSLGDVLVLRDSDEVEVVAAPGLDADSLGRYQVDGDPIPLGRPGQSLPRLRGYQVNLRRVRGHQSVS